MLDRDIMTMLDAELPKAQVVATMVGGKLGHGDKALSCGN